MSPHESRNARGGVGGVEGVIFGYSVQFQMLSRV